MMSQHASSGPGVVVREDAGRSRKVQAVSSSVTGFVGRTWMGPVDRATTVRSFSEFRHIFGGLHPDAMLASCVEDYFANGGREAVIVRVGSAAGRVASAPAPATPADAPASNKSPRRRKGSRSASQPAEQPSERPTNGTGWRSLIGRQDAAPTESVDPEAFLPLEAASAGAWANGLTFRFRRVVDVPEDVVHAIEVAGAQACWDDGRKDAILSSLFSLDIEVCIPGEPHHVERYDYLSASPVAGPLRVDRILEAQSNLVRLQAQSLGRIVLPQAPLLGVGVLAGGADGEAGGTEAGAWLGSADERTGLHALVDQPHLGLLCVPPDSRNAVEWHQRFFDGGIFDAASALCQSKRALLILDAPGFWTEAFREGALPEAADDLRRRFGSRASGNVAVYFPWLKKPDPTDFGTVAAFPPCGAVAGVMARTEANAGVWKAPAGIHAQLRGITGLEVALRDAERAALDGSAVNCLRAASGVGPVVWGNRVLGSAPGSLAPDMLSVRRLALHIEQALYHGTQWAVFQPNDERLWSALRASARGYLQQLQHFGALTRFSVSCGPDTTTADELARGLVNVEVGFTPVGAAEYVVLYFQQHAAQA